jgi:hypothetical protein
MAGPKPFNDTLVQLRFGELHEELTDAMNELVSTVDKTQKGGKLVLTLTLKPGKGGQIELVDDLKVTLPKQEKGSSIMFATPEGNLQREDPRQRSFEGIRSVDQEIKERRAAQTEQPLTPRAAAAGG